jgi:hypothetical protein
VRETASLGEFRGPTSGGRRNLLPGVWGVKGGGQECPRDWTLEQFVMWVKRVEHNFDPPPARWDIRDDPSARQLVEDW